MTWKLWLGMIAVSLTVAIAPARAETQLTPATASVTNLSTSRTNSSEMINQTYTFTQINGLDGFSLKGSNATRELYLPILREWNFDSATLHLIIYRAAFLAKSTTLTIYANNRPIDSIELSGVTTNKVWDVTLPSSLVKNSIINLSFNSVVNEVGFSCYNLINPAYWIYVSGDSTVTYHYRDHDYFPDLTKLPYPFIHDPSLSEDSVLIVVPDVPSLKILSATFNIANMLGNKSTWRGVKLNAISTSMLQANQKPDSNIILIGTGKDLQLNSLNAKWPLSIDSDGTILGEDKQKIKDNVGVIMLTPSPYNPKSALLTVTGNTDLGVNNAALMLRNPDFINSVLYNSQVLVLDKPEIVPVRPHWNDITLKMLGFENQTVYGSASDSLLDYNIELPRDKKIKAMKLSVNYVVSTYLKNYDAPYLTIRVNGTPVGGASLVVNDDSIKTLDFTIDGANLLQGKNQITFDVSIKMDKLNCNPQTMNLAWVTLYSSTQLHVDIEDKNNLLDFQQFSASTKDLAVVIPSTQPFFGSIDFIRKVLELGKLMQQTGYVDFYDVDSYLEQELKNSDILYMGDINASNLLQKYKKTIPFYFVNNALYIAPDLIPVLSISSESPAAITELLPSPLNQKNLMMLVTAKDKQGYMLGIDVLTDHKKNGLINGNIALTYVNGTFNSVQSQKLTLLSINKKKIHHVVVILYYVLAGLVLFVLGVVLFIIIKRKIKYYFSKNHD